MNVSVELTSAKMHKQRLHIKMKVIVLDNVFEEMPHIMMLCESESGSRVVPLPATSWRVDGEQEIFIVNQYFEMERIVGDYFSGGEIKVSFRVLFAQDEFNRVNFSYNDPLKGYLPIIENELLLKVDAYQKKEKKIPFYYPLYCAGSFLVSTCLLPMFLLDGLMAYRGYKKMSKKAKEKNGFLAVWQHASGLVKLISGVGYEREEWQHRLWNWVYKISCFHSLRENRVLLLAEYKRVPEDQYDYLAKGIREKETRIDVEEASCPCPWNELKIKERFKIIRKMASSKVIIVNDRIQQLEFVKLRKETLVVRLAGDGSFLKDGYALQDKMGISRVNEENWKYEAVITNGKNNAAFISESYGIPMEKVKLFGMPGDDVLTHREVREKIKADLIAKYPVLSQKRVILFAPSYRGTTRKNATYPDAEFKLNELFQSEPENTIVIIRSHPYVRTYFGSFQEYENRILQLNEESLEALMCVADVMITDYHDAIFQAAAIGLPIVFFIPDHKKAMAENGVYYDYETYVPGPIAQNMNVLCSQLKTAGAQKAKLDLFARRYMETFDGYATDRIAGYISDLIKQ